MVNQFGARALVVLAAVYSTGCATINAGVDPWARKAGVTSGAPVILQGDTEGLRVYRNGSSEPLKIVTVENPDFKTALGNATRQGIAENSGTPGPTVTYIHKTKFANAVYLKQKGIHTLRFVRKDGLEASVTTKSHVGMKYVVVDWLLVAPTFGASILIDWSTGKWKTFDAIDLQTLFANASTKGGGSR